MPKQFYFKQFSLAYKNSSISNQLSISTQFSSIYPIDRTLSGTTILGESGPASDGNEEVLRIPQSSSIIGTSPSDSLVSYTGRSLWGCLTPQQRSSRWVLQPHPTGPLFEGTETGTTTSGHSGPDSNGDEGVLHIP